MRPRVVREDEVADDTGKCAKRARDEGVPSLDRKGAAVVLASSSKEAMPSATADAERGRRKGGAGSP